MYHSHHMCCEIMDVSLLLHGLGCEAAVGVYRRKLLEILNGGMQMARTVESTIGFGDVFSSNDEISPMIWHAGHRSQAVAMKNYPALLVSCEIKDDDGMTNADAKFVVMFFGIHQTESGRLPVVQVMARCQNMILLPKMVLLRMNISGDVSSFAEIVDFDARKKELVPTRFMHLKRDFVWNTVQSVISWDEDRQRVAARLQQVIPFVSDESTGSFSDEVSQDTLAQLEAWLHARFQVVGDPPRVMRKLFKARGCLSRRSQHHQSRRERRGSNINRTFTSAPKNLGGGSGMIIFFSQLCFFSLLCLASFS